MAKKRRDRLPAGINRLADGRIRIRATYVHPLTGQRKDRNRTLPQGTDLSNAVAELQKLRVELMDEAGPPESVPSVRVYVASWLARKKQTCRPKTHETYVASLANLTADLGNANLDALERKHLVWWRDQLQKEVGDYSISTVQRWWRYGITAIRDALAEYDLPDITRRLEGPVGKTEPKREQRTFTREELGELLGAIKGKYGSMVRFMARTGCRFGEAAGLRWCDVELQEPAHARLVVTATEVTGGFQRAPLKSGHGRVVGLSDDLVEALKAHRAECPGVGEALVWGTRTGKPAKKIYVYRVLDAAAKRIKLDIKPRPQVFRRTFNSLGLAGGLDRVFLQELLGHAGDEMTKHYHGLRPEAATEAVKKVWG